MEIEYCVGEGGTHVGTVKAEEILYQLRAIAMADVTGVLQVQDGSLEIRSTEQLPRQLRCAIASVEKSTGGIKVKFYDKLKALELLGKYLGLFDGSGADTGGESPLLEAILQATKEVSEDDLERLQQQAAADHDLVEPETLP